MNTLRLLALTLALWNAPAAALEFTLRQTSENLVSFAYKQMGVPLDGKFKRHTAQIAFDPTRLDSAQARIEIDLASIDTGSTEADEEVLGKPWFNAKSYPVASFVANGLRPLGGSRYEAVGKLTLKGRTQSVTVPVTFQQNGTLGVFDGAFTLKRLDFAIGEGAWADTATVANEIQIRFHFVVHALPARK